MRVPASALRACCSTSAWRSTKRRKTILRTSQISERVIQATDRDRKFTLAFCTHATLSSSASSSSTDSISGCYDVDCAVGDVRDSSHVQEFISTVEIANDSARLLKISQATHTVVESAAALGVNEDQVVKSIVLCVKDEPPLLALARGTKSIQLDVVARHVGVPRRSVRLALPAEVVALTGFAVGAVPPFAHATRLRTLVDASLLGPEGPETVVAGGGDHCTHVVISPRALLEACGGEAVHLQRDVQEPRLPAERAERGLGVGLLPTCKGVQRELPASGVDAETNQPREAYPFLSWVAGAAHSQEVEGLVGEVTNARVMSRLLLFADVHPLNRPPPSIHNNKNDECGGGASGEMMARLASAARVQIIVGKTMRARGCEERTQNLIRTLAKCKNIKTVVRISGRLQSNPKVPECVDVVCSALEIVSTSQHLPDDAADPRTPPAVEQLDQQQMLTSSSEPSTDLPEYLSMDLADILLVDSIDKMDAMRDVIEAASDRKCNTPGAAPMVIGLDAEWQPDSNKEPLNPVSILQVAVRGRAMVVDLLGLCRCFQKADDTMNENERTINDILQPLLADASIHKLGFSLDNDVMRLRRSYPHMPCFRQIRGVVEIRELMLSKHAVLPDSVYARGRPSGTLPQQAWRWGLSQTVEFVLGRRLDKSLQKSNWAHRPLSDAQVRYAAIDAHCLTQAFDVLTGVSAAPGDPILPVVGARKSSDRVSVQVRSSSSTEAPGEHLPVTASIPTTRVCADVDSMMSNHLGRPLPGKGKAAVVAACVPEGEDASVYCFSQRGGSMVWQNAIMLFVNLKPSSSTRKYNNVFSTNADGDLTMSWYSATGQTFDSKLVQDLLAGDFIENTASRLALAQLVDPSIGRTNIVPHHMILFGRHPGAPYVLLGRIRMDAVDTSAADSLCVTWRLLDGIAVIEKFPSIQKFIISRKVGPSISRSNAEAEVVAEQTA